MNARASWAVSAGFLILTGAATFGGFLAGCLLWWLGDALLAALDGRPPS